MKANSATKRDMIVVASREDLSIIEIGACLHDAGFEMKVAKDEFEMGEFALKDNCAAVFIDDTFCLYSHTMIQRFSPHTKAQWIFCVRGNFSESRNQLALNCGAYLVLHNPRSPTQYVIRSKQAVGLVNQDYKAQQNFSFSRKRKASRVLYDYNGSIPAGVKLDALESPTRASERWKKLFASYLEVKNKDYKTIKRDTFRTLANLASLGRNCEISLHTFRPDSPLDQDNEKVKCLSSSKQQDLTPVDEKITQYPELQWCKDQDKTIVVTNKKAVSTYRTACRSRSERGIVSIPMKNKKGSIIGAVRISFPTALDANMKAFAKDMAAFTPALLDVFASLDFFSRLYNINNPAYSDIRRDLEITTKVAA